MLMHRQAPLAIGALAACAVVASGSVLLREQILTFSSWPDAQDGSRGPEIAIPHGIPLAANGGARAPLVDPSSRPVERTPADRALLSALGLTSTGGRLTVAPTTAGTRPPSPAVNGGDGTSTRGPSSSSTPGPSVTTTGPSGSGTAPLAPVDQPLAGYGNGPVTGDAAPASGSGSSTKPRQPGGPSIFTPTPATGTTSQAAVVAPDADATLVNSAADDAPKPADPDAPAPAPVDSAPSPAPETPAPAPETPPAPAEQTPPSDPTPPVEETAPGPAETTPAPSDPAPQADPPPSDPAPADPTPPADPVPPADPAPTPASETPTVAPESGAQTAIPASAQ